MLVDSGSPSFFHSLTMRPNYPQPAVMTTMVALVVTFFLACLSAVHCRMQINFNYAWRFHFGDEQDGGPGPGYCAFENISGYSCSNMYNNPNHRIASDCMMDCCYNSDCLYWQFSELRCLHGGSDASCTAHEHSSLEGGFRPTAQPIRTN